MKKNFEFWTKNAQFRVLAVFLAPALLAFAGCNKEIDDDFGTDTALYRAAVPTSCPPEGPVSPGTQVHLATTTDDAAIYYTTDGSEPGAANGTQYTTSSIPQITSSPTTIKAIAIKDGMNDSPVATFEYTINNYMAATPTENPPAGEVDSGTQITLSTTTEGAAIYYTTDGSEPSAANGTLYTGPITIDSSVTIKAIAIKDDMEPSAVQEFVFTIAEPPEVYNAVIDLAANAQPAGTGVTYSGNCYTITENGSYKAINSTLNSRIAVDSGLTVSLMLQDASIELSGDESPLDLGNPGTITLRLEGENVLSTSNINCAALHVGSTTTLIINSVHGDNSLDGSLLALAAAERARGAGIGSMGTDGYAADNSGTIQIRGGTVTAYSYLGAGIGGGGALNSAGNGGVIKITGGKVIAASREGAGIGGGDGYDDPYGNGASGNITIEGGEVEAYSEHAAAIGAGYFGGCDSITISGGSVAAAVNARYTNYCATIGGYAFGSVNITGGTVIAVRRGSDDQSSIGGNSFGGGDDQTEVTISGNAVVFADSIQAGANISGVVLLADDDDIDIATMEWDGSSNAFTEGRVTLLSDYTSVKPFSIPSGWVLNRNNHEIASSGNTGTIVNEAAP